MDSQVSTFASRCRLYRAVFLLDLQKILFYRGDFWVRMICYSGVRMILAFYLWQAMFSATGQSQIGGYGFSAMMFYYLIAALTSNVLIMRPGFLSQDIYDGTLTKYLLYPVSLFAYKYVSLLPAAMVTLIQLILCALGLPYFFEELHLSSGDIGLGLVTIAAASILYYSLFMIIELIAFWADHVWNLWVMMIFLLHFLGGNILPLSVFPPWAHSLLYVTPFPYLIDFPVKTMMGEVSLSAWVQGMGVLVLWTFVGVGSCYLIWRAGLKRYTGVGM